MKKAPIKIDDDVKFDRRFCLILLFIAIMIGLLSCSKNSYQHNDFYKKTLTGKVTDIKGNTVFLDSVYKVFVWTLSDTLKVGKMATFHVKKTTAKH